MTVKFASIRKPALLTPPSDRMDAWMNVTERDVKIIDGGWKQTLADIMSELKDPEKLIFNFRGSTAIYLLSCMDGLSLNPLIDPTAKDVMMLQLEDSRRKSKWLSVGLMTHHLQKLGIDVKMTNEEVEGMAKEIPGKRALDDGITIPRFDDGFALLRLYGLLRVYGSPREVEQQDEKIIDKYLNNLREHDIRGNMAEAWYWVGKAEIKRAITKEDVECIRESVEKARKEEHGHDLANRLYYASLVLPKKNERIDEIPPLKKLN